MKPAKIGFILVWGGFSLFLLIALFLALFVFSYQYSRGHATSLISRIPSTHILVAEGIRPIRLSDGGFGFHYFFSFEPEGYLTTAPLHLEYSILGTPIGSNPHDLLSQLTEMQKNNAQQGAAANP